MGAAGAAGDRGIVCVVTGDVGNPEGCPTPGLNSVGRSGTEAVRFGNSFSSTAARSLTFPYRTRYRWTDRDAPPPVRSSSPIHFSTSSMVFGDALTTRRE
ncbi:MAG: hypothetical protein H6Q82_1259 [Deltaproteobacteria bacterium]|nr:hypothetical protein [Deltaproteobacteria bacterium]